MAVTLMRAMPQPPRSAWRATRRFIADLASPGIAAGHALLLSHAAFRHASRGYRLRQHLRWPLLAAARPSLTRQWFQLLKSAPLRPFARAQPHLCLKPLRPYLSIRWNCARRMKVIADTLELALRRGGPLHAALCERYDSTLAQFNLAGGESLNLTLGRGYRFRKEGEFVLSLRCGDASSAVMQLAFSLEQCAHGLHCYIGCVQGVEGSIDAIRDCTKTMQGLRPKTLLFIAVQAIARSLGVITLQGISNASHVYLYKQFVRLGPHKKLRCDYDALWLEHGGRAADDGWFELPLDSPRRGPQSIAVRKRAEYRRRYALIDELHAQIERAFYFGPKQ